MTRLISRTFPKCWTGATELSANSIGPPRSLSPFASTPTCLLGSRTRCAVTKHATLTLLDATLTRGLFVSPVESTLTKNRGGGGRTPNLDFLVSTSDLWTLLRSQIRIHQAANEPARRDASPERT